MHLVTYVVHDSTIDISSWNSIVCVSASAVWPSTPCWNNATASHHCSRSTCTRRRTVPHCHYFTMNAFVTAHTIHSTDTFTLYKLFYFVKNTFTDSLFLLPGFKWTSWRALILFSTSILVSMNKPLLEILIWMATGVQRREREATLLFRDNNLRYILENLQNMMLAN